MTRAQRMNQALARTITIGVNLGAEIESGWTLADADSYFALCKDAGFSAVRLAVVWVAHTTTEAPFTIDEVALEKVADLVDAAVSVGLAVVLDNHLDPALMIDPAAHRDRLLSVAKQVAQHFKDASGIVALEPLAESRQAMDAVWNVYLADLVAAIREIDPARTLVVGPAFYNTVLRLDQLLLPDDGNLILSIHQYWPIPFTMQGEEWFAQNGGWEWLGGGGPAGWLGTTWTGTDEQVKQLRGGYDQVAEFAARHDVPVFIGEFGATSKADPTSRTAWARANRELAEAQGFAWGWWSFAPTFALYDTTAKHWNAALLEALTKHKIDNKEINP